MRELATEAPFPFPFDYACTATIATCLHLSRFVTEALVLPRSYDTFLIWSAGQRIDAASAARLAPFPLK